MHTVKNWISTYYVPGPKVGHGITILRKETKPKETMELSHTVCSERTFKHLKSSFLTRRS